MALAKAVYAVTIHLPESERFGLVSQLRRSAISVPSNIAEGFGRETRPDFLKFLRVARGSLFELRTQIEIAENVGLLAPDKNVAELSAETDRVLQGLIRGLIKSKPRVPATS